MLVLVLVKVGANWSLSEENGLASLVILVGMLAGGSGLVWLKLRLAKEPLKR